jgi:DNA polymerase-3 subunit epsilon
MNFIAIDVETANSDLSSICQIGITQFVDGKISDQWESLIDPETHFDWMNTMVHGIEDDDIRGKPTFNQVFDKIKIFLEGKITISHSSFDKSAISKVTMKYGLEQINTQWVDSAKVARRTWPQFAKSGYGLKNLSEFLSIEFKHHDALEDSMAAGTIILRAIEYSGTNLNEWISKADRPITPSLNSDMPEPNIDGGHFGEILVFTGALFLPRREMMVLAANSGCTVASSVTKKTTILVVGDQDLEKLAGHTKSSKHRKAEELIKKGQRIRILSESDFSTYIH